MNFTRSRHLLEYAAVRILLATVLSMGIGGGLRLADLLGSLLFRFDKKHRLRALDHLARAFPERPEREREEIARSSFQTFCRTVVESVFADRLMTPRNWRRTIDLDMDPEAERALQAGKGAVFVSAHFGNWEFTSQVMWFLGYGLVSVARPTGNPYLDRLIASRRELRNQKMVEKRGAFRELSRALRKGTCVGLVADQHTGHEGIVVQYFGRPAGTTGAPAMLALRYGVPLIPGYVKRTDGVFRFVSKSEPPLVPPDTGDRERDIFEMTQAMTSRFEAWVREDPGQWLWSHRRWKADPEFTRVP